MSETEKAITMLEIEINKTKLEFGNKEHIAMLNRLAYLNTVRHYEKKLKVNCPKCGTRLKNIVEYFESDKMLQWQGCPNEKCCENINNADFGKQELWGGITDLKGKLLD